MARYKRTDGMHYMGNISCTLPVECIATLDRYKKTTGNNRSLALEYIIRDWERIMEQQKKEARK